MNYNENKPTTAMLSHESLDVYQLALKFHLGVMDLLPKRSSPTLRDQLERASTSIILNTLPFCPCACPCPGPCPKHELLPARKLPPKAFQRTTYLFTPTG